MLKPLEWVAGTCRTNLGYAFVSKMPVTRVWRAEVYENADDDNCKFFLLTPTEQAAKAAVWDWHSASVMQWVEQEATV